MYSLIIQFHCKSFHFVTGFICIQCGKIFKSMVTLNEHIDIVHKELYLTTCSRCEIFATNHEMNFHKYPNNIKVDYRCKSCKLTFIRHSSFRNHINETHPKLKSCQSRQPYQCTYCNERFMTNSNLNSHIIAIHLNGLRRLCICCAKYY